MQKKGNFYPTRTAPVPTGGPLTVKQFNRGCVPQGRGTTGDECQLMQVNFSTSGPINSINCCILNYFLLPHTHTFGRRVESRHPKSCQPYREFVKLVSVALRYTHSASVPPAVLEGGLWQKDSSEIWNRNFAFCHRKCKISILG